MNSRMILSKLGLAFLIAIIPAAARARIITLSILGQDPQASTLNIDANESVKVLGVINNISYFTLTIEKSGIVLSPPLPPFTYQPGDYARWFNPLVLQGPATLHLAPATPYPTNGYAFVTVEVTPEAFPPDKTFSLAEGASAAVALETSTNLLNWTSVSSNTFSDVPTAQFFRLKAQRLP